MVVRGQDNTNPQSGHSTPRPSYKEQIGDPSPVLLATTTTTEIVTTTTHTTHFFSLPLWTRRGQHSSPSPRQSSELGVSDNGVVSGNVMRKSVIQDKDLPPIPCEDADSLPTNGSCVEEGYNSRSVPTSRVTVDGHQTRPDSLTSPPPSFFTRTSPRKSSKPCPPSSQSTVALAHAALGLGLTYVIPNAASSSSEVNTVAFKGDEPSESEHRPHLRRERSTKFRSTSTHEFSGFSQFRHNVDPTRTRGTSLGGVSGLLQQVSGEAGRGKEMGLEDEVSPSSSSKTLSRRPSFWRRKKKADSPSDIPPHPTSQDGTLALSLPIMQPLPPINLESEISPSTPYSDNSFHLPISRSYSDQRVSHPSSPELPRDFNSRSLNASSSEQHDIYRNAYPPSTRDIKHDTFASPPSDSTHNRPFTAKSAPPRVHSYLSDTAQPVISSTSPPSLGHSSSRPSLERPSKRPRANTNPPLLHRLSINIFSSSSPSSFGNSTGSSPIVSTSTSPRPSIHKVPAKIPKPHEGEESPEVYLNRVLAAVSKSDVAGVLASSGDTFFAQALQAYVEQFNFLGDPLDVALRKLLMDVGLPRETQQIDRVMEAFAKRYQHCNANLFVSDDHPYILAFSLIMLHTDAFNKSNKRKMTKPDYIKNTRLPGVFPEILDCFYDNIVFAPFIFVEDPLDANGQRGLAGEANGLTLSSISGQSANTSGTTLLGKTNKVDPYYLISNGMLGPLRVDVEAFMPLEDPYSFAGTAGSWDEESLQSAFVNATVIEVGSPDNNRTASPFFGLSVGGAPLMSQALSEVSLPAKEVWTLKVAKAGVLNRKDDMLEGGKKATNRKWKPWSVFLTASQLLFFRETMWANTLLSRSESSGTPVVFAQAPLFKPEEALSLKDSIAVFDKSYNKYPNTLRFAMPSGRQFLLQVSDETELNEWVSHINYASAFRSAGVRMRILGLSGKDMQLTGVAAAKSHLHDIQNLNCSTHSRLVSWAADTDTANTVNNHIDKLSNSSSPATEHSPATRKITILSERSVVDLDVPMAPEVEGADQLKATFDEVKAELAAGNWTSSDESSRTSGAHSRSTSPEDVVEPVKPEFTGSDRSPSSSRSQIIRSKVKDLESNISTTQSQLDDDLRFVRNIATLTPFQRTTRGRLQLAVQNVAKRIMQLRLDLSKLVCHRDVLADDLAAEWRDWRHAKKMALRAATETLQSRHFANVPRMTFSFPDDEKSADFPDRSEPHAVDLPYRSESPVSISDSFHSALDLGLEWSMDSDDVPSSGLLAANQVYGSLSPATSGSAGSFTYPLADAKVDTKSAQSARETPPPLTESPSQLTCDPGKDTSQPNLSASQETLEEQAEDWNKTRCAQRVSLVRMPSDIRLSSFFRQHSRYGSGDNHPTDGR